MFTSDIPIDCPENDILNRNKFAESLAKTIIEWDQSDSIGMPISASALYGLDQQCPYKYIDDDPDILYIPELGVYAEGPELAIEMVDEQTQISIRSSLKAIQASIDEAVANNDYARIEEIKGELEMYDDYLDETSTPSGKIKKIPGQNEKARRKIRQAVEYYLNILEKTDPAEAEHIRRCIVIGNVCMWSEH